MLLTPTVGVPPLPIGAYKLSTLQRQGLKLLAALPAGALLSQRPKVVEAFAPVFEAAPYTMVANVTGQPSMSLPLHWTEDGLPMGMLFTAQHRRRGDAVPTGGAARAGACRGGIGGRRIAGIPMSPRRTVTIAALSSSQSADGRCATGSRASGGDAVVIVHGFGGSLESWAENQRCAGRSRAHGCWRSTCRATVSRALDVGSGSLDELATAVLGYLDALGLDRVHLVGHSMGAAVCLVLADRVPQRVRSLTLIGPAGIGQKINADFIRGFMAATQPRTNRAAAALAVRGSAFVTPPLIEQIVAAKQRAGVVEALARIAVEPLCRHAVGRLVARRRGNGADARHLGCRRTRSFRRRRPGEFARAGVELHVLPGRGHMVQIEAADEVNRLIAAFLGR